MTKPTRPAMPAPFTEQEKRTVFSLAHSAALDSLHEAQQTIAWLEGGPDRMSRHSLLRNHRSWTERAERGARELANAKETVAKRTALVEKIEALFAIEEEAHIEAFAEAFRTRRK
jgi:hypothetical protein